MLNLSDNELDKISREAAEKFEPSENAQSWNKLEQLLDNNLGKPTPIPKTIRPGTVFMYSGAILVAAALTYFLTKSKKINNNSTPQISKITVQKSPAKGDPMVDSGTASMIDKTRSSATNGAKDDILTRTSSPNDNSDAIVSNKNHVGREQEIKGSSGKKNGPNGISKPTIFNSNPVKTKGKETVDPESSNGAAKSKFYRSGNDKNTSGDALRGNETVAEKTPDNSRVTENKNGNSADAKKFLNADFSEQRFQRNNSKGQKKDHQSLTDQHRHRNTINSEKTENSEVVTSSGNSAGFDSVEKVQSQDQVKFASIPEIETAANTAFFAINDSALRSFSPSNKLAAIVNPGQHRGHGAFINKSLQIGILFAPEFSEVKHIYQNNKLGNNFGITLGYQLFSKISLNTAIIFSKKYYQANEQGFHAPPGTVGNDVDIKFVDASANVVDIPLNIRYNYFSDENSVFFVNGGFSSYLVSKQNVNLYCQPNNASNYTLQYPGRWIRPSVPSSNKNYLFSILNLSAGFETNMGNNFSFQFEPYVKLPVKGIGVGKVDLSSYGINFSLKYSPVLKRGRN